MFERLIKWLTPAPITVYKLVEVSSDRTHKRWDEETKMAVASLDSHPGFQALRDLRAWQVDVLKSKLLSEHHDDLRKVDFLQNGVYWLGWDNLQVAKATQIGSQRSRTADWAELEELKEVESAIERFSPTED